jgi:hypothetical protein
MAVLEAVLRPRFLAVALPVAAAAAWFAADAAVKHEYIGTADRVKAWFNPR